MNTIIQNEYDGTSFIDIDTFYHEVVGTMDTYLTKVIFCRVLHIIGNAISDYSKFVQAYLKNPSAAEKQLQTTFSKLFGLKDRFEIFLASLLRYINHRPLTLNQQTIQDILGILSFMRARFNYHLFHTYNPVEFITFIKKHLHDERFHRDETDIKFSTEKSVDLSVSIDELEAINVYLIHMTEVKTIS